MDNSRDVDNVMMNVQRYGGGIMSLTFMSARISLQVLTMLYRLAKKGVVAVGMADQFKNFSKNSEGNFTVYNIPLTKERAETMQQLNELELKLQNESKPMEQAKIRTEIKKLQEKVPEIEQLDRLNIKYCVLPKINGSDQTIQVAIAKNDDQMFKNWYLNHLTSSMKGGQLSMEEMKVFTEGNYSIFNLPMEGEEFETALKDFDTLGINYSVLPDLNIGDGNSQVAVTRADRNKFEVWIKMWRDQQIKEGKQPAQIYEMNQESYMNTGSTNANGYINNADPMYQEANKEFAENGINPPWKNQLGKENSPEFIRYLQDDNYHKITINKETLLENKIPGAKDAEMEQSGYFISRIPGKYGDNQLTLILPSNQVFQTDAEKTFVAFIPKNADCMVSDLDGNISSYSYEDIVNIYNKVDRGFGKVEKITQQQTLDKANLAPAIANMMPVAPKM